MSKEGSVSKIRENLQDYFDNVHYTGERLLVLKNGKPWVEIHPLKERGASKSKSKKRKKR